MGILAGLRIGHSIPVLTFSPGTMQEHYTPSIIEPEAQAFWQQHDSFKASMDPGREKFYCLSMFPYP